ncbi:MAG: argininosuccinate lyase [Desulfobacterales bacterium]|nr:argininosuccinate lyase [Desulfobacterales bacterium]
MANKPWDGRFSEKTHKDVEKFTSSIAFDKRLYAYDIEGSIAHCTMLAEKDIILKKEAKTIVKGLNAVRKEIEKDQFREDDRLEDIHMHIESRLTEIIGKPAQKLHTARSRNDQVALDVRMYLREECKNTIIYLVGLRKVLVDMAKRYIDVALPGYTHLQRAQPVLWSHHLMAYYEMFNRDTQRFQEGLKRINVMPLGSAALAGTTYPIDRALTARLLNFPEVSANSIDSVSDRDFAIEYLSAASICMMHLSRFSEELILWSSSEFKFIDMPDAFATGSSIMPQKKNPDIPELVRGKTGRVYGSLMTLLTIMKSLPLAYNRDMQEDKEPLFDAVDTLNASLKIYNAMLPNIKPIEENMFKAANEGFLNATDLADYLTSKGMPFRQAHGCAGKAVGYALKEGKELHELSLKELKSISNLVSDDIFIFLTIEQMINRRVSEGGTAKTNVSAAIRKADNTVKKEINMIDKKLKYV